MAPGSWVRCPNCSQPVRFEAPKPPPRPKPAVKPVVSPPPLARPDVPAWTPRPVVGRRLGCGPAALISLMGAFAEMLFSAAFLSVMNPYELLLAGAFGFFLVMGTGYVMLAASSRPGWESTKNNDRRDRW